MARLPKPSLGSPLKTADLVPPLTRYLGEVAVQVNGISDGSVSASTSASTAPPSANSTQSYFAGDMIRNKQPTEFGTGGSKYVITGWICTQSGQPGVWLECRSLTGN